MNLTIKYYVRTCGDRELHSSLQQINYELLEDPDHQFAKIFPDQLRQIAAKNVDGGVVLLEDDVILCRDFKNRIEQVIQERPKDLINFFTNPLTCFKSGYYIDFCYNQCTYIPFSMLNPMADYFEHVIKTKDFRWTPERLMYCYFKNFGIKHYCYRPCLVQHIDDRSLIGNNLRNDRRTPYFIDYLDDLGITYEEAIESEELTTKLMEMMFDQFAEIDANKNRYNRKFIKIFVKRCMKYKTEAKPIDCSSTKLTK